MPKNFFDLLLLQLFRFQRSEKCVPDLSTDTSVNIDISLATDVETGWKILPPIGVKSTERDVLAQSFSFSRSMLGRHELCIRSDILDLSVSIFKAVLKGSVMAVGFGSIVYHAANIVKFYSGVE
jgi:hypothetical protein